MSCFILSCSNLVHCPRINENHCPLCFVNWEFLSLYERHSLLDWIFSESVITMGTSTSASYSPWAITLSKIASFIGATTSIPAVTAASRMVFWVYLTVWMLAWPILIMSSRRICRAMTSGEYTGTTRLTVNLCCNSLLMSCP